VLQLFTFQHFHFSMQLPRILDLEAGNANHAPDIAFSTPVPN
jgi:hypothetical protein